MTIYKYELFADYFQFYLQDEAADGDLSESWTEEATTRQLALAPGTIGVGTARNMTVPVTVEIRNSRPDEPVGPWDLVNDCNIEVTSGKLVVAGCTDYLPDAARIELPPGLYHARVFYGGLQTLSNDGLDGDDHYTVILWPEM